MLLKAWEAKLKVDEVCVDCCDTLYKHTVDFDVFTGMSKIICPSI